ncbi:MAG: alkaline phosphatase family protein [Acidiferrobacterales bacterium]
MAQKLAGYRDRQGDPSPQLKAALVHADETLGKIISVLRERRLLDSTLVIVTAKHGNRPVEAALSRFQIHRLPAAGKNDHDKCH